MLSRIDFEPRITDIREATKRKQDEQRVLKYQVSVVMSEVKGDPRWKVYADHLQAMYERHLALAHAAKERLGDPMTFLSPEENGKLKLQAAYNQGKAEGFKGALDVIKDLIDRGKEPEPIEPEKKMS